MIARVRRMFYARTEAPARDESGGASVFVIGMSVVLLACAGLVIDGGQALNTRARLADDAEQAARAGADAIDVVALREGRGVIIDRNAARQRAAEHLSGIEYSGDQYAIQVLDEGVRVVIRDTVDTALLQLIRIDEFTMRAEAFAEPLTEAEGIQGAP